MSELTEGERARLAIRSEQELAITEAAFDGLRIAMVNELIGSNYDEAAKREHLYHGLRAIKDVQGFLLANVRKGNDTKAIEEAAAAFAKGSPS
jgi:hypothetical protein